MMTSKDIIRKMKRWHMLYGDDVSIHMAICIQIEAELSEEGFMIGVDSESGDVILYLQYEVPIIVDASTDTSGLSLPSTHNA